MLKRCVAEQIAGRSEPLTENRRREILQQNLDMAAQALRVLAMAYRENQPVAVADEDPESDLIFAGLAGMIDPPRDAALTAVEKCRSAGIRPVMITGDQPATAQAIARDLQIAQDHDQIMSGPELEKTTDDTLSDRVDRISVYVRVSAAHKLRIVSAWKKKVTSLP